MLTLLLFAPAALSSEPPRAGTLSRGWEIRAEPAAALPSPWRPVRVPSVFSSRALARLYLGEVRRYRLRFTGPQARRGFGWRLLFEGVRRSSTVFLNGRRIGGSWDPYTPFTLDAPGLRSGRRNVLEVVVDSRKDPALPEAWWNWGGIVRPVRLLPVGRAHLRDLGTMSRVRCLGPARRCRALLLLDAVLERRGPRMLRPTLQVQLRSPAGRRFVRTFRLPAGRAPRRRVRLSMRVPTPELWSPEAPRLYHAQITLREAGSVQQADRRRLGLRSVEVKRGLLHLNNRRVQLRGASIHEDMPGSGAALTAPDVSRIVAELDDLGANVVRAHYLMNEQLLRRFDEAGIMVWNQAPVWQRDQGARLLHRRGERRRALSSVERTVLAARSHPSVLVHSVANELSPTPDTEPGTALFLQLAQRRARDADPTLPVALDIFGVPGVARQATYRDFDAIGVNQYFGWYDWVPGLDRLQRYLSRLRQLYPKQALVMTEWGAEARPELAAAPVERKGGYAFQARHVRRTLDVVDRSPSLSGAIYWALREFEIYPGWEGGAGARPAGLGPNTRHHKGVIGYEGTRKPAFRVLRDRYLATSLYP